MVELSSLQSRLFLNLSKSFRGISKAEVKMFQQQLCIACMRNLFPERGRKLSPGGTTGSSTLQYREAAFSMFSGCFAWKRTALCRSFSLSADPSSPRDAMSTLYHKTELRNSAGRSSYQSSLGVIASFQP